MKKKIFHYYEVGDRNSWSFRAKIFISEDDRVLVVFKGLSNDEISITGDYETALRKMEELMKVLIKAYDEVEAVKEFRERNSTA
jgi:hypothetical protein